MRPVVAFVLAGSLLAGGVVAWGAKEASLSWRPGRVQVAHTMVVPLPAETRNKAYEAAEALRFSAAVEAMRYDPAPESETTPEPDLTSEPEPEPELTSESTPGGKTSGASAFGMYQALNSETVRRFRTAPKNAPKEMSSEAVRSYGTAILLDVDRGIYLTCLHVVRHADKILLHMETPEGGKRAPAQAVVTAYSEDLDLALLQTEAKLDSELRPAPLASGDARIGDPLLVVGNPYGTGLAVSFGFVAALNRKYADSRRADLMDVRVAPGFSGGAVVNLRTGKVIGVCFSSIQ